jgi:hypothetical protein
MIPSQVDSSRASFAGNFIGAIFYGTVAYMRPFMRAHLACPVLSTLGMVILLFFQCMVALFNPYNHTRTGIRWGLVTHTVAMFLSVTIHTAVTLDLQFISCTSQQEFPGDGAFPGYNPIVHSVIPNVTFQLNQWLVDGLLVSSVLNSIVRVANVCVQHGLILQLYRCRFKHLTSYRAIALPCLLYLAAVGMYSSPQFDAGMLGLRYSLSDGNRVHL